MENTLFWESTEGKTKKTTDLHDIILKILVHILQQKWHTNW
jgi:hypothetical protein